MRLNKYGNKLGLSMVIIGEGLVWEFSVFTVLLSYTPLYTLEFRHSFSPISLLIVP